MSVTIIQHNIIDPLQWVWPNYVAGMLEYIWACVAFDRMLEWAMSPESQLLLKGNSEGIGDLQGKERYRTSYN
jgi:hypothetical protein